MTSGAEPAEGRAGARGDLTRLLVALWRERIFVLAVTAVGCLGFLGYSFVQRPTYAAKVTILPRSESPTAALLGPVASMLEGSLELGDNYEQVYAQILVSDRILDQAIARTWRHVAFAEPASLYQIFGIDADDSGAGARQAHGLKTILRSEVIAFTRQKTGLMVLTVNAPLDGEFAAELANFLVDRLDSFNTQLRTGKAQERYEFLAGRLADTESELAAAEQALTDFKVANRAYAASPELSQEAGVLAREVQALTTIWVEIRKQLELAEIERKKQDASVDVLDRAAAPVVRAKPQRGLHAVVGLFGGFLVAVLLLILRSQLREVRSTLEASSPR